MVSFLLPSSRTAAADRTPITGKPRKPRFELHLKIYDLNNVPLASGVSTVKWHLPHSLRSEHRGRTEKRLIAQHRVEYNYGTIVSVRLALDRDHRICPCAISFEVWQEFEARGAVREERTVLGKVSLNLAEYITESDILLRGARPSTANARTFGGLDPDSPSSGGLRHTRTRSISITAASANPAPTPDTPMEPVDTPPTVEDGVVRRYLLQDSRINSTLRIGILMVQVDGERNYIAPPLRSAPVFGAIAGVLATNEGLISAEASAGDDADHRTGRSTAPGTVRDAAEIQDVYRRSLAAAWACRAAELPADECIEDLFAGGDGFRRPAASERVASAPTHASDPSRPGNVPGRVLGSVQEGSGWPEPGQESEPTAEDDAVSVGSGRTTPGLRKTHRSILPRLGPIRRKTGLARTMRDAERRAERRAESATRGSGSGSASGSHLSDDGDEDDASGEHLHVIHGREDSGLSDRTITPGRSGYSKTLPWPNRAAGVAVPTSARWRHDHLARDHMAGPSRSGSGSGSVSGHDEAPWRTGEVNEHEVRDDLVAWQRGAVSGV